MSARQLAVLLPWIVCLALSHAFADMMKDSPVTFPKHGALPAMYPPDRPAKANEATEKDYYIFRTPERSLAQIKRIQAEMPKGDFTPPPPDWKHLRRTRRVLNEGGTLHLLALGDSIVNDTMRSGWVALLRDAYPKADIQGTIYVRGGGGCQHYREADRIAKNVVPRKPDLVLIGGISQRSIEDIREVIHQLRAALPEVEILLATGTFGTADPRDAEALAKAPHSGTGAYGQSLKKLAAEQRCAYLDMTTPWAQYIRSAKVHPHLFYRDVVHANEFGEQILAKIMMAFWRPAGLGRTQSQPKSPALHPPASTPTTPRMITEARAGATAQAAKVRAYPLPPGLAVSSEVTVEAGGTPIPVESLRPPYPAGAPDWFRVPATENMAVNIVRFSSAGPCRLAVHLTQPIKDLVVRPRHREIPVTGRGREFTLSLPGPCKLVLEMDPLPPLLVFADPPEENVPRPEEVTRFFGPGVHTPGLMTLQDHERVYLAAGAVVYGGIRGGPRGAKIYGRGILDGSRLNSSLVMLDRASQVEMEGIVTRCGRGWQNTLRNCDEILYRNVKVLSFVPYGDGLDPVCSRNIRIEDCFFRCSDDCIAVKGMKGGPKVSGITVRDCVMAGYTFSDGFTVGFEADTECIENVSVKNCDVLCALGGNKVGGHSAFSIICDGPAEVRNVTFEDIRVEENVTKLFELHVTDGAKIVNAPPGHIRDVRVKNVHWSSARPIILHGHNANHLVQEVTFEGCTVAGKPLTLDHLQTNAFVKKVVIPGN